MNLEFHRPVRFVRLSLVSGLVVTILATSAMAQVKPPKPTVAPPKTAIDPPKPPIESPKPRVDPPVPAPPRLTDDDDPPAKPQTDEQIFQSLDTNEDGQLSGKEAKPVLKYDANSDGRVSKAEFLAGRQSERKVDPVVEDDKQFTKLDITEDGFLSGKEKIGYEALDSDGDGEITKAEFMAGLAQRRAKGQLDAAKGQLDAVNRARAEKLFAVSDANEDGRLSGTEIGPYKDLDANGDGMITKEEFLAGLMKGSAPEVKPAPPKAKLVDDQGLKALLDAMNKGKPELFSAHFHDAMKGTLDEPFLAFLMQTVKTELGAAKMPAEADVKYFSTDQDGQHLLRATAEVEFAKAKVECVVILLDGQIGGFRMNSPVLTGFDGKLHAALIRDPKFARQFADYYRPRSEKFIRQVHGGQDEAAFATFHPDVQQQVTLENAQKFFANVREKYGDVKGLEWESITVDRIEEGKPKSFSMAFDLTGEKGVVESHVKFQFDGLRAVLVGYETKETEKKVE